MFIDNTIELDVATLPVILQNIIKDCELYDNIDDEILYEGKAEALEINTKHFYAEKVISQKQRELICRKYCRMVG